MKSSRLRQLSKKPRPFLAGAVMIGLATGFTTGTAKAVAVDSELLLLVDITRPEMNNGEFNRLMNSYASTFTNSQLLNTIQSGATGRIAVSLMFYGDAGTQITAVPWMSIGNAVEAQTFANLVSNVTRPTILTLQDPAAALTAATASFGTETGGLANGFESTAQIIDVVASSAPSAGQASATATSSANAFASGVDVINSVALGNNANAINSFFAANVIGSTLAGVNATSSIAVNNGSLPTSISAALTVSVQNGATASVTAVPEPSSIMALIPAALLIFRRRRG